MSARSFWPPAEASQVDYETLRAQLLENGRLSDGLMVIALLVMSASAAVYLIGSLVG